MLVAGCYERFLFGFKYSTDETSPSIVRTFNYPAHKGAVKCLAAAGNIITSGGADDLIHLYDVHTGRDLGFLMNPGDGAVTALAFHRPAASAAPSHLLNGSSDGSISVWQAGSWDCLKTMLGHKGEVNSIAVHPIGNVALSVGRDRELRVWNLVKGKVTYHSKLAAEADLVNFHPSGNTYALVVGRTVSMHSLADDGAQLADMPHPSRVLCASFCGPHGILTGCEDGSLRLWDSRTSRPVAEVPRAHATRVRGVAALGAAASGAAGAAAAGGGGGEGNDASGDGAAPLAASASSDGTIRLWDLRTATSHRPLAEVATSARLTCLVHASPGPPPAKQQAPAQRPRPAKEAAQQPRAAKPSAKQQRQQQPESEQPAQPKAKQKIKLKAKHQGGREAAPSTKQPLEQPASGGKVKKRKQQAAEGAAPAATKKSAKKGSKRDAAAGGQPQEPEVDRGVLKRGRGESIVEFAPEDAEADEGPAMQKPQKQQQQAGGKQRGDGGGGGQKAPKNPQLRNLDRFD